MPVDLQPLFDDLAEAVREVEEANRALRQLPGTAQAQPWVSPNALAWQYLMKAAAEKGIEGAQQFLLGVSKRTTQQQCRAACHELLQQLVPGTLLHMGLSLFRVAAQVYDTSTAANKRDAIWLYRCCSGMMAQLQYTLGGFSYAFNDLEDFCKSSAGGGLWRGRVPCMRCVACALVCLPGCVVCLAVVCSSMPGSLGGELCVVARMLTLCCVFSMV